MNASGFGSVVIHSTADSGIASSIPLTPTKITKRKYVLFFPRKNASLNKSNTPIFLLNISYQSTHTLSFQLQLTATLSTSITDILPTLVSIATVVSWKPWSISSDHIRTLTSGRSCAILPLISTLPCVTWTTTGALIANMEP